MEWILLLIGTGIIVSNLSNRYYYNRIRLAEKAEREERDKKLLAVLEGIDKKLARVLEEKSIQEDVNGKNPSGIGEFAELLADNYRKHKNKSQKSTVENFNKPESLEEVAGKDNYYRNRRQDDRVEAVEHNGQPKYGEQKYANVLQLAARGLGGNQIAEELDLGVRETELLLRFQKQKAHR